MVEAFEKDPVNAPKPCDISDSICLAAHALMQKRLNRPVVSRFSKYA